MGQGPVDAMGGGCRGGIVGAGLGVVLGGFLGPLVATSGNDLRHSRDGVAKQVSSIYDFCGGFMGLMLGVGIGGTVGGIVGAVLGAGLATRDSGELPVAEPDEPPPDPAGPSPRPGA